MRADMAFTLGHDELLLVRVLMTRNPAARRYTHQNGLTAAAVSQRRTLTCTAALSRRLDSWSCIVKSFPFRGAITESSGLRRLHRSPANDEVTAKLFASEEFGED
jgi:hypothetical protein